ncbi:flagellar assembly peptidoglycan hydrolase FlgJ [Bermanella marisrubri]|uniref:Peptidoglycan hydrolase FlgJ n=1 Tax=Bermanella marisrubri TaxID=207949 RepID=Q1N2Z6_9GAMM|nr:flagellar assembly peptidoglycan hydrolase FlgJ [Bermanella marisrubri]EAT12523.1 Muramidase (flagellum-specific) [Oceanobacter sp. RED65] [Bermanella marisrubri]QIZ84917.1 flagellar assembly peptidoglycan hydrolase FlgJ [Bermanella marisrubri]
MNALTNTYNYNDLSSLNKITQLGNENQDAALKEVAKQFESMFIKMMLKSMRDANAVFEEGNPLNTNESKFYRQMHDDQLALSMSKGKGVGLADSIYRQMKQEFNVGENETRRQVNEAIRQFNGVTQKPSSDIEKDLDSVKENKLRPSIDTKDDIKSSSPGLRVDQQKQSGFSTPQEFVQTLWPIAQKVGKDMGVEPKAILAQAALETGWGKHLIHHSGGQNSFNLFGIKADRRWGGESAEVSTLEYRQGQPRTEMARFRVYDSYESSMRDYSQFVSQSERYQDAVSNGQSIKHYSEGLQKGGYATDPFYAQKIQRIAHGDVLNSAIQLAGLDID